MFSQFWVVPPKMVWSVKAGVFFFNLVGVFPPSVLNHLSASLVQLCRRNSNWVFEVERGAILPRPRLACLGGGGEPPVEGSGNPWWVEGWPWMCSNHYP